MPNLYIQGNQSILGGKQTVTRGAMREMHMRRGHGPEVGPTSAGEVWEGFWASEGLWNTQVYGV